jgi:hypothetical protein
MMAVRESAGPLRAFPALACSVCSIYKCYVSELEGFLIIYDKRDRTRSDNDKTSVTYIHTLPKHCLHSKLKTIELLFYG